MVIDNENKFIFHDKNVTIQIDNLDFAKDISDVLINYTTLSNNKLITNYQFKKKLKRTVNKVLRMALKNAEQTIEKNAGD